MGRKQKRSWQYILLFPAVCLIVLNMISGCRPRINGQDLPSLPVHTAVADVAPPDQENTAILRKAEERLLDQADALLKSGKVGEALTSLAKAISCCTGHPSQRASDLIALALAHPRYRADIPDHMDGCLQPLLAALPMTDCGQTTGCLLAALNEMSAQEIEIEKLKKKIRSQVETITTLKEQITRMKAVDLEFVRPEPAAEVP
jgi:hypothetical protein